LTGSGVETMLDRIDSARANRSTNVRENWN
jgi:hypothetical protein